MSLPRSKSDSRRAKVVRMPAALSCTDLSKTYGRDALSEVALANVSLSFDQGETCMLLGPSGSGKTTLLSILGCLLSPSAGEFYIEGIRVPHGSPPALVPLRRQKLGFVFQHAQLLPFLTVEQNLRLVGKTLASGPTNITERIADLIGRLGIAQYVHRKPGMLSGGQRQRVAIARAVLHRPAIILADEPTAALDWTNGQAAIQLLVQQAKAEGSLLIVVTHDTRLETLFDRVLHSDSGRVRRGRRRC